MAKQIEEPTAGQPINKLWKIVADLVKAVNAMQNMKISPEGIGKVTVADGNIVIELNTTDKCP